MHLRRPSILLIVFVFTSAAVVGCASGRRRQRRPPGPPVAAAPPAPPQDASAIWFGSGGAPKKKGTTRVTKKVRQHRVLGPSRRGPALSGTSPIATNLAAPVITSRDWIFVDAFKLAGPWFSRDRKGKRDTNLVRLDPKGWVQALNYGQQAGAKVPSLAGGKMVVLYDGRGIVTVKGATTLGEGDGRLMIRAKPYSTFTIVVESTNPSDNVRNIRVVPEALEPEIGRASFHPLFVRRLSQFSVLRFADWGKVASSRIARWEDRTAWDSATQTGEHGVAYEYMIDLANTVGADPWICVPYGADDKFVEALAELVSANLDEDLKVYIEYATDVWRPGTPAYQHAQREGTFRNLDRDPQNARLFFQSRRSLEIFQTFERVFDGSSRVVRVIGSQNGATGDHERLLGFDRAAETTDILAIDAFVGEELVTGAAAQQVERRGLDWLMDQMLEAVPKTLARVRASASIADRYRVGLATYQGGQGLRTDASMKGNAAVQTLLDQANRDRRMKDVYTALLDGWRRQGGELFVHDSFATPYGNEGRAGSIEYIDQPRRVTPKHDALLSFAEKNRRWWDDRPKGTADGSATSPPPPPPPPPLGALDPPPPPPLGPTGPTGPTGPGVGVDVEPVSNAGVWTAGTVGATGAALGWLFTGLYLSAASSRDVLIAEQLNPADGQPARDLDNSAYRASIGTTLGFSLALAGAGTAVVMSAVSDIPIEDAAEPAMWLSGTVGLVSGIAGTAFLVAHLNTASARDARIADNPTPMNSAPIRTLDNEAQRWSLAALGAYTVSAAGIGVAVWLLVQQPKSQSGDYYLDTYYEDQGFTVLPTGLQYRW